MLENHLIIGEVLKPQGIKGQLKIRPITCDPERFYELKQVLLMKDGQLVPQVVRDARVSPDAVFLTFDGVRDRDQAEALRGELLYVDRAHAVQLPEDADFICDLIGCVARDDQGREIGTLVDVMQPGAGDVYVFRGPLGEVLVPALKSVVLEVNTPQKRMLLSASRLSEVAVFDAP